MVSHKHFFWNEFQRNAIHFTLKLNIYRKFYELIVGKSAPKTNKEMCEIILKDDRHVEMSQREIYCSESCAIY